MPTNVVVAAAGCLLFFRGPRHWETLSVHSPCGL